MCFYNVYLHCKVVNIFIYEYIVLDEICLENAVTLNTYSFAGNAVFTPLRCHAFTV